MPTGGGGSGTAGMLAYRRRSKPNPGVGIDRSYPLSQGLVQYWTFNEGSAQSARDLVNGYSAATVGSTPPVSSSGVDGLCLYFPFNANCYIATSASVSPSKWTIAVRLKVNALHNYQSILVNSASTFGLFIKTLTPDMYFGGDNLATAALTQNTWSTLVVTHDGATLSFFIDGKPAGTSNLASTPWSSAANKIGSTTSVNPLEGSISWLAMWARALSPTEVESATENPWQCCLPPSPRFFTATAPFSATGAASVSRHPTVSSSASYALLYRGASTLSRHPSIRAGNIPSFAGSATLTTSHPTTSPSATGTFSITFTGTCTTSRHPTVASTGTRAVPSYTGTGTVSRHPTVSSAGQFLGRYTGTASASRHPTISATGTRAAPTYTGTCSVSRHPTFSARSAFAGQATLAVRTTFQSHGGLGFFVSQTLNLFAKADTVPTYAGTVTLFAAGHSAGTTGGLLSSATLYASGWDDPPYSQINMYASGYVPLQGTSGVMNMYAVGGHPTLQGSVSLYAENAYGSASSDVLMYAAGQGKTPGALPASGTLNMFVQRGPQDGVFMYAENRGVAGSVDLYAGGSPQATGQVQMFASGLGGTTAGTVMMAAPKVTQPTPSSGQVMLATPKVTGVASGSAYLYAHGWTP